MKKKASTWVIIDYKTGNANQVIAVAEAMGLDYEIKRLKYNFLGMIPNWLKFDTLMGVDLEKSDNISEPFPELIISGGRKTAAVSSYIKKTNPETFVVHFHHPDLPFENFDIVSLPFHDFNEKYKDIKNIVYTIGAPSYLEKKELKKFATALSEKISPLKAPFVSLIIGGKTKNGNYSPTEIQELITKASALTNDLGGSLLISTSRRTTVESIVNIKEYIKAPYYFYDWHLENGNNNPYYGFLGLSDYIIVTGDSVSTCSEALSTGKPVYVYRKDKVLYKKHIKFLDYLAQMGYTKQLNEETSKLEQWEYKPLMEAQKIGKIITEKLNASTPIPSQDS